VVGRYILTPRIFDKLLNTTPGAGGEIQLTDGIAALLKEEAVLALPFKEPATIAVPSWAI
jgi:UTP--glucose-1-phosphate uridylyltransferase